MWVVPSATSKNVRSWWSRHRTPVCAFVHSHFIVGYAWTLWNALKMVQLEVRVLVTDATCGLVGTLQCRATLMLASHALPSCHEILAKTLTLVCFFSLTNMRKKLLVPTLWRRMTSDAGSTGRWPRTKAGMFGICVWAYSLSNYLNETWEASAFILTENHVVVRRTKHFSTTAAKDHGLQIVG